VLPRVMLPFPLVKIALTGTAATGCPPAAHLSASSHRPRLLSFSKCV